MVLEKATKEYKCSVFVSIKKIVKDEKKEFEEAISDHITTQYVFPTIDPMDMAEDKNFS